MTDWATISSLATAGATLALALGTFASVRSANRAARAAERTCWLGSARCWRPRGSRTPPTRSCGSTTTGPSSAAAGPRSSSSTATSTWPCRYATSARASRSCRAGIRHRGTARASPTPSSTSSGARLGISTFPPPASASGRGPCEPGRRDSGAAPVHHRAALQRPRRRPAHHQPLLGHPSRRRRRPRPVAVLRRPALEPRPAGPALAALIRRGSVAAVAESSACSPIWRS
jgi:hypothetical protein